MNPRLRNYGILAVSFLIVAGLTYLSPNQRVADHSLLLLLPLILLAGYWEGLAAALGLTLLAALFLAGAFFLGWLNRPEATIQILNLGLTFGLSVVLLQTYEAWVTGCAGVHLPLEAKLLKVERKARLIRGQIEDYERRLKALSQLYDSAKKLMSILDLTNLVDEARTVVGKVLPEHFGPQAADEGRLAFYIPREETGDFQKLGARGHEISDEGLPEVLGQGDLRHWLGETFAPVRVKDVTQDPHFRVLAGGDLRALVILPLVMHEILIGVMLLGSDRENAFAPADFNQASVLAKQIVFALRKALLYRKVQTLSITDNLTGLYVQRHFQDRFREELHRAERYKQFLSLVLLDLDNFKRVNDEHGHPTGDAVLAEAAARIREASGATALVARYGGEEFAVLLPHAAKARGLQVAQNINALLKATPIDLGGARLTITVSAGVSTYPEDALTRETLITSADSALYEAKHNGRDLVCSFARRVKENP